MNRLTSARQALAASNIMEGLSLYQPTVVSTIWAGLDIETSDINILCSYQDEAAYRSDLEQFLSSFEFIEIESGEQRVVARFQFQNFPFEIFASPTPIEDQSGWRHFQIMQRLVELPYPTLISDLVNCKRRGMKTEPAIAKLLRLEGDPYESVLSLEQLSALQLGEFVKKRLDHGARWQ